jgi:hypothetical protein
MAEITIFKKITKRLKRVPSSKEVSEQMDSPPCPEEEITKQDNGTPLAEYRETLHSAESIPRRHDLDEPTKKHQAEQRLWRDVDTIESEIDDLHDKKETKETVSSEIERKVDRVLSNKKKK